MERLEYFAKVMKVVTELMGVTEEEVLGKSKVMDVVDARWMAIQFLHEKGYSTRQISHLMNHPERTINHALEQFEDRATYSPNKLGNIAAIARQQLL